MLKDTEKRREEKRREEKRREEKRREEKRREEKRREEKRREDKTRKDKRKTEVEDNPKAPFSLASATTHGRGGRHSFPVAYTTQLSPVILVLTHHERMES